MTEGLVMLRQATLSRGGRVLWKDLDAVIYPGEFIAVLGPNGAGKTSLLKVLLGMLELEKGSVQVDGQLPHRGNPKIGYVPQHRNFDPYLPVRGYDLVRLGLDGHRYGLGINSKASQAAVRKAIRSVGASDYAGMPVGLLSGGEQQRLRIAQALVGEPRLLLCDEPLLSLDLASQRNVTTLINDYKKRTQAAVLFVTHEINPVLPAVDRVLYMANGKWVIDTPAKVLTSKTLSMLYGTSVEVVRIKGRVVVVGAEDVTTAHHEGRP